MINIKEQINKFVDNGYSYQNAEARLCQDIVLTAIGKSPMNRNVTIKGGVVMRSVTGDVRRATQDVDIDFIRYSLEDSSIKRFIEQIDCIDGITISLTGETEELKQQDYHGKRTYIKIQDSYGNEVRSKIDFGVHKNFIIEQEEYCFDICFQEDGVSLLINSYAQMFVEKLRSLLKFGPFSTRYKDVFDMLYLKELADVDALKLCLDLYIYSDTAMRENTIDDVRRRTKFIFGNKRYLKNLQNSDKNWMEISADYAAKEIQDFLDQREFDHTKTA